MKVGIVAYGVYVPLYRIKVEEIARVWSKDAKQIVGSLGVREKAVAAFDEDACTLAVEAARRAIKDFAIESKNIGAVFVGSESHPYAVNPTSSIVGEAIDVGTDYMAADLEFACKAGTAAMQICCAMCSADMIDYGLAIGTDTAQGRPNDALEFTAGSGAGAIVLGTKHVIAEVEATTSFTTDTPDFWRRQHAEFPEHAGRFTGEPAYFRHVLGAAEMLMHKTSLTHEDFDYVVFHQPNAKFPLKAARKLGFPPKKLEQGLLVPYIGNTYSAATMIGICSVLDVAQPGERILAVSYGSGAGSDAFSLKITKHITRCRAATPVFKMIERKLYVDYATYAKFRRKIKTL
jgi:hydroxymethylglutaryl-CoA synthase